MTARPRYVPDRPLPAHAYIPGVNHRPPEVEAAPRDDDFLFGCDLYNHGFFWEAHEQWEALWHRLRKGTCERLFVQGLIQVSAAHLKRSMGKHAAASRLLELGLEKITQAARLPGQQPAVDARRFSDQQRRCFSERGSGTWPLLHRTSRT